MITVFKDTTPLTEEGNLDITKKELLKRTEEHIDKVYEGLSFWANLVMISAKKHDYTKISHIDEYFDAVTKNFKNMSSSEWYTTIHIIKERHHLLGYQFNNINLIDVLEYITDCVMAGLARKGSLSPITIPDDLLKQAFNNTIKLLENEVVLEDRTSMTHTITICYYDPNNETERHEIFHDIVEYRVSNGNITMSPRHGKTIEINFIEDRCSIASIESCGR